MNTLRQDKLLVTNQFKEIVQFVLNADLRQYFKQPLLSVKELKRIVAEFKRWNVPLEDQKVMKRIANESILKVLQRLEEQPSDLERIEKINIVFDALEKLDFKINGWQAQNLYFNIVQKAKRSGVNNPKLVNTLKAVGKHLGVGVNFEVIKI